jgi:DNA-binding transcriptional ArsR family regulator
MDVEEFARQALAASNLLKAMSNESRLLILCQLVHGEKTVGELEEVVSLSQSALSQHLAVLRQNDLVKTRRSAQSIFYSLAGPAPQALIETLYRIYGGTENHCIPLPRGEGKSCLPRP